MAKHWIEEIFEECGAILDGHFVLASDKHSGKYLEKAMVFPDGEKISDICFEMACSVKSVGIDVDVVVGPASGGIVLAHETAKHLSEIYQRKVLSVFTEKNAQDNQVFRLAFKKIVAGRRVLIVDDILTTGGSVSKVIRAVQEAGGYVMAIAVICDRREIKSSDIMNYPLFSLWDATIEIWKPPCPLCQKGMPITNTK